MRRVAGVAREGRRSIVKLVSAVILLALLASLIGLGAVSQTVKAADWQGAIVTRLTASYTFSTDVTSHPVAISGDTAVVGCVSDDVGANVAQGSAYVFVRSGGTWSQQAKLTASDGATNDWFGASVAISGDTVVVGASNDQLGLNPHQGSAYIFVRSGTAWSQQKQLIAGDGAAEDGFGGSVAISGDTVVVGACRDDVGANIDQGSAYVFTGSGNTWTQQAQLTASDGVEVDRFGVSVAISGDTAVVGAPFDYVAANGQGSAYIFTRSGTAWSQQKQLTASDGAEIDRFGMSVAISGDTAVVGAPGNDLGTNLDQGSAYVFVRSGTAWSQQKQLTAGDGAAEDGFGWSVAISGDTAVVGAPDNDLGTNLDQGSAYVFVRSGTTWSQQKQLTASDGALNDSFGQSVAISEDTAVVGHVYGLDQGSAHVFTRSSGAWTQQAQLIAIPGAGGAYFGDSAAISGATAVVGVPLDDVGTNADQGSAYVFTRSGGTWPQKARLTAIDGAANDQFGCSVAISGDTAVIGACLDDVGANADQGSAYVFVRVGTDWVQMAHLVAIDGAASDQFGWSVAISGDTVVVGACADEIDGNVGQGSAYVFTGSGSTWTQEDRLTAIDGAANDRFGCSVAISGATAVIGACQDDVGGIEDQGSAYVFGRVGTDWVQMAQLIAIDGAEFDRFGYSVAISGDTVIVGAYTDNVASTFNQGSAYVFLRSGAAWNQQAQLSAGDGAMNDYFGCSVGISGDTAVVGAYWDDVGANADQGSAYVFTRSGAAWSQQAQLTASNGAMYDWFGASVAISDDTALVGAPRDDVEGHAGQGSAYVYEASRADLYLWMQASGPVIAGNTVQYLISVENIGPSSAANVVVVDDVTGLPLQNVQYSLTGTSWFPWHGSLTYGDLDPGPKIELYVRGTVDPAFTGNLIVNTASASSDTPDNNMGSNSDTSTSAVTQDADLSIVKDDAGYDPVMAGTTVQYRILVYNWGPSTAFDVALTEDLTALPLQKMEYSFTNSPGSWFPWLQWTGEIGFIGPRTSKVVYVRGTVDPAFTGGQIVNNVCVAAQTPDSDTSNNCANQDTTVTQDADLWIEKSANETVVLGTMLQYSITVHNDGPSTASNVVVTDSASALPLQKMEYSFTNYPGSWFPWKGWTGKMGDMKPGASKTVYIRGTVSVGFKGTQIVNTACVASAGGTPDSDAGNNCATTTTIIGKAKTQVTTQLSSATITLGSSITDTATVSVVSGGTYANLTGTVSFQVKGPGVDANWREMGKEIKINGPSPVTVTSLSFAPNAIGTWYFRAVYSGSGKFVGSETTQDEVLIVT